MFRNFPGTVLECVRICGLKRNLSNLDRAPKMRDSVLMNSWDSFLVTSPSISSKICLICSWLILGMDVFRDWPFRGCSFCVSLATAANFGFFSQCCHIFEGKVLRSYEYCIRFHVLIKLEIIKKCRSSEKTTSRNQYSQLIIKMILRISPFSTFIFPIYTFSLAGNITDYTPCQGTK